MAVTTNIDTTPPDASVSTPYAQFNGVELYKDLGMVNGKRRGQYRCSCGTIYETRTDSIKFRSKHGRTNGCSTKCKKENEKYLNSSPLMDMYVQAATAVSGYESVSATEDKPIKASIKLQYSEGINCLSYVDSIDGCLNSYEDFLKLIDDMNLKYDHNYTLDLNDILTRGITHETHSF